MRSTILFAICSLITGCSSIQRPNSYAFGVNAPGKKLRGYNLNTDYDQNGQLKAGAQPMVRSILGLQDLNGAICFLPRTAGDDGIAGVKTYLGDVRDWAKEHCQ